MFCYDDNRYNNQFRKMVDIGRKIQRQKIEKLHQQKLDMGMLLQSRKNNKDESMIDIISNVSDQLIDVTRRIHQLESQERNEIQYLQKIKKQEELNEIKKKLNFSYVLIRSDKEGLKPTTKLPNSIGQSMEIRRQLKEVYSMRSTSIQIESQANKFNQPLPEFSKIINNNEDKSPFLTYHSIKKLNDSPDLNTNQSYRKKSNHLEIRPKAIKQILPKLSNDFFQQFFVQLSGSKENLSNARVYRINLKLYLLKRYSDRLVDRFMNFFEISNQYDFQAFKDLRETIVSLQPLFWNYLFFFIYDLNEDRLICNTDLFRIFTSQAGGMYGAKQCIGQDLLQILKYVKTKLNETSQSINQIHILQRSIFMRQTNMTLNQLRKAMKSHFEKRKIDVKRNTIFLNNYGATEQDIKLNESQRFFVNQNMELLSQLKELLNEKKPFAYKPEQPFSINFNHFQEIFSETPPAIYLDMINYLGMGDQNSYQTLLQFQQEKISSYDEYMDSLDKLIKSSDSPIKKKEDQKVELE